MEKRPSPKRLEEGVYKNIPVTGRPAWVNRAILVMGSPDGGGFEARMKDKVVLDLGAGRSGFVGDLLSRGVTDKAYAVDFIYHLPEELGDLEKIMTEQDIPPSHRVAARLEELPFKDGSVDLAVAYASLPLHADSPKDVDAFFTEAIRVLAINGEVFISPTRDFIDWMTKQKKGMLAAIFGDSRLPDAFKETAAEQMEELGFSTLEEYRSFLKKKYAAAEVATAAALKRLQADPTLEVVEFTRQKKTYSHDKGVPVQDSVRIKKIASKPTSLDASSQ